MDLASVTLNTANTGCGGILAYSYVVTNGTSTAAHMGQVHYAFANIAGSLSASATEVGEASVGTGCSAGCDTFPVQIVGSTATLRANFDNSLSVAGTVRANVLYNSCPALVLN